MTAPTPEQRAVGSAVASTWAERDTLDPATPSLGELVARTLAAREEAGAADLRQRMTAVAVQREGLAEEQERLGRKWLDEGNTAGAVGCLSWAATLRAQAEVLRLVLSGSLPVS